MRAIARAGDALYVAVNDFDDTAPAPPFGARRRERHQASRLAGRIAGLGRRAAAARASARPRRRCTASSATAASSRSSRSPTDTSPRSPSTTTGGVYVATGTQGRVYRVDPDRTAALAIDLPERQALTLVRAREELPGRHRRRGRHLPRARRRRRSRRPICRGCSTPSFARAGACCAGTARTGSASRRARGTPPSPTRAGRRSTELEHPRASGDGGAGQVASPAARYVQYRVTFGAPEARVGEVTLAYLPQNQRARVTEISVGDARRRRASPAAGWARRRRAGAGRGTRGHRRAQAALEGREPRRRRARLPPVLPRAERGGLAAARRPRPADQARVRLEHRGPARRHLRRPRGRQRRARAAARARRSTSSLDSAPILVDNRKPEVAGLVAKYPFVSGRARDDQSPLTELEYAVDGGDWQILAPADGICDDLVEAFTLKLPDAGARPARGDRARLGQRRQRGRGVDDGARGGEPTTRQRPRRDDAAGCRPRPRSSRSRSACCRTSARSCYCPDTREAAIVDPAWEVDRLLREVDGCGLQGHDGAHHPHPQRPHRGGRRAGATKTGAAVVVSPREAARASRAPGRTLVDAVDGRDIAIGRRGVRALDTPGHTVGGTCYLADGYIVTGDVLFVGGCGRTDFPGGDTAAMWHSLQRLARCPRRRASTRATTTARRRPRRSGTRSAPTASCAARPSRSSARCASASGADRPIAPRPRAGRVVRSAGATQTSGEPGRQEHRRTSQRDVSANRLDPRRKRGVQSVLTSERRGRIW